MMFPACSRAHNWQPMAFSPETGLVYIPAVHTPVAFKNDGRPFEYKKGG